MIPMHEYYKQLLPSEARYIYEQILKNIGSMASEGFLEINGSFDRQSMNNAVDAYLALRDDHPEYYFLDNRVEATISLKGNLWIKQNRRFSLDEVKRINNILRKEIKGLLEIPENLGVLYKEDIIYNRIIKKYRYRDGAYSHDVSGLMINGEGVCESLSGLLVIALREIGIPTMKVHGIAKGERHCWTQIMMFDRLYYQDITWDLTNKDLFVTNRYYNLTKSEISLDHKEEHPKAFRTTYNYHL